MSCRHAASPRALELLVPGAAFLAVRPATPHSVCVYCLMEILQHKITGSVPLFSFSSVFLVFGCFFLEGCHLFFHNVSEPGETTSYKQHAAL